MLRKCSKTFGLKTVPNTTVHLLLGYLYSQDTGPYPQVSPLHIGEYSGNLGDRGRCIFAGASEQEAFDAAMAAVATLPQKCTVVSLSDPTLTYHCQGLTVAEKAFADHREKRIFYTTIHTYRNGVYSSTSYPTVDNFPMVAAWQFNIPNPSGNTPYYATAVRDGFKIESTLTR